MCDPSKPTFSGFTAIPSIVLTGTERFEPRCDASKLSMEALADMDCDMLKEHELRPFIRTVQQVEIDEMPDPNKAQALKDGFVCQDVVIVANHIDPDGNFSEDKFYLARIYLWLTPAEVRKMAVMRGEAASGSLQ